MDTQSLTKTCEQFVRALENGKSSTRSPLPFIRHALSSHSLVEEGEIFQSMVVGGSFYQKAPMKKVGGKIQMISQSHGAQPVFLTEKTLMAFLHEHIDPQVTTVALNFAYPLTPVNREGRLDGRLTNGSKENTFEGLVGKVVGESVEKYFSENHGKTLKVSVANDTICLLLSGLMSHSWDSLAAGVVGTGLNFAIFLDEHTTVNLESAEFDRFEQTATGRIIDEASLAPGSALFEKEVSGAYLYHHFNMEAEKRGLGIPKITKTKEIDEYMTNTDPEVAGLAQEVLTRSASLVAVQVAGILTFCKRDLTFIMQGSLFWKGTGYQETVARVVAELSPQYKATFEQIPHSDLYGAAKLVG